MLARRSDSVVVLIDVQPTFMKPILGADRILRRCMFLLEMAKLLGVPILATEQNPSRMGGLDEGLANLLEVAPIGKMCFSSARSAEFNAALDGLRRKQAVLVGIETPICVNQTAHDLIDRGYEVLLAVDAIGARSAEMHEVALRRMGKIGAVESHTESIAYEWLESAEDSCFREALAIVKKFSD